MTSSAADSSVSIPVEASAPTKRVRVTRKSFLLPPVTVMGHEVSMHELMEGVVAQRELARSVWSHLDDNEMFQFFVTVMSSKSSETHLALKGRVGLRVDTEELNGKRRRTETAVKLRGHAFVRHIARCCAGTHPSTLFFRETTKNGGMSLRPSSRALSLDSVNVSPYAQSVFKRAEKLSLFALDKGVRKLIRCVSKQALHDPSKKTLRAMEALFFKRNTKSQRDASLLQFDMAFNLAAALFAKIMYVVDTSGNADDPLQPITLDEIEIIKQQESVRNIKVNILNKTDNNILFLLNDLLMMMNKLSIWAVFNKRDAEPVQRISNVGSESDAVNMHNLDIAHLLVATTNYYVKQLQDATIERQLVDPLSKLLDIATNTDADKPRRELLCLCFFHADMYVKWIQNELCDLWNTCLHQPHTRRVNILQPASAPFTAQFGAPGDVQMRHYTKQVISGCDFYHQMTGNLSSVEFSGGTQPVWWAKYAWAYRKRRLATREIALSQSPNARNSNDKRKDLNALKSFEPLNEKAIWDIWDSVCERVKVDAVLFENAEASQSSKHLANDMESNKPGNSEEEEGEELSDSEAEASEEDEKTVAEDVDDNNGDHDENDEDDNSDEDDDSVEDEDDGDSDYENSESESDESDVEASTAAASDEDKTKIDGDENKPEHPESAMNPEDVTRVENTSKERRHDEYHSNALVTPIKEFYDVHLNPSTDVLANNAELELIQHRWAVTFKAYLSLFPQTVFQFIRHRKHSNVALQHSRIMTPTVPLLDSNRQLLDPSTTLRNGWSHLTSSVWFTKYKQVKWHLDSVKTVQTNAARFDKIDTHGSITPQFGDKPTDAAFVTVKQLVWDRFIQNIPALQGIAKPDAVNVLHPIDYATASRIAVLRMSRLSREVFDMACKQSRATAQRLDVAHEAYCMQLDHLAVGTKNPQLYDNFQERIEGVIKRSHPMLFDSQKQTLVRNALRAEHMLQVNALNKFKEQASTQTTAVHDNHSNDDDNTPQWVKAIPGAIQYDAEIKRVQQMIDELQDNEFFEKVYDQDDEDAPLVNKVKSGKEDMLYTQCLNYLSDLDQSLLVLDTNGSIEFDAALRRHRRSLLHKNNGMLPDATEDSHTLFLEFVTLYSAYHQDLERATQFVQCPPILSLNATENALLSSCQLQDKPIPVQALRLYEHRRNILNTKVQDLVRSTNRGQKRQRSPAVDAGPSPSSRPRYKALADAFRTRGLLFQAAFDEKRDADHDTSQLVELRDALQHLQKHSVSMYLMDRSYVTNTAEGSGHKHQGYWGPAISSNYALFCSGSEPVWSRTESKLEPPGPRQQMRISATNAFKWQTKVEASCFDDEEYLPRPMASFVTAHYRGELQIHARSVMQLDWGGDWPANSPLSIKIVFAEDHGKELLGHYSDECWRTRLIRHCGRCMREMLQTDEYLPRRPTVVIQTQQKGTSGGAAQSSAPSTVVQQLIALSKMQASAPSRPVAETKASKAVQQAAMQADVARQAVLPDVSANATTLQILQAMGPFGSYVDMFSLQSALGSDGAVLASNLLKQLRAARSYPAVPAFHWAHDSLGDYITASTTRDSQWSFNLNELVTAWVQRAFAEEVTCARLCQGATMTGGASAAPAMDDIIKMMQHNTARFNQIVVTLTSRREVIKFLDERLTPHLFHVPVALPVAAAAGSSVADARRVCIITDAKFVYCHDDRANSTERVMVFKVSEFKIAKVQEVSRSEERVSDADLDTISRQLQGALSHADELNKATTANSTAQQLRNALRSIQTLIGTCKALNKTSVAHCVLMAPPHSPAQIPQIKCAVRYYTEIQRQQAPAELKQVIPTLQTVQSQKLLLESTELQAVDRVYVVDNGAEAASAGGDVLQWPQINEGQSFLWMTMDAMTLLESDRRIPDSERLNWRAAWNVFNAIRAVYAQTLDRMINSFELASTMLKAQMLATTKRASTVNADRRKNVKYRATSPFTQALARLLQKSGLESSTGLPSASDKLVAWTLQNGDRDVQVQTVPRDEIKCLVEILKSFDLSTRSDILSNAADPADPESAAWQRRYALMQDAIDEQPAQNVGGVLSAFEAATAENRQRLWKKLATQGLSDALRIDGLLDPSADWLKLSSGPPSRQLEAAMQKVAVSQDEVLLAETRLQLLEAIQLAQTADSSRSNYDALIRSAKEKVRHTIAQSEKRANKLQNLLTQVRTAMQGSTVGDSAPVQQRNSSLRNAVVHAEETLANFDNVMNSVETRTLKQLNVTLNLFRIQCHNVALLETAYQFVTTPREAHLRKAEIAQELDEQLDREFYLHPDGLYLQTFLPAIIKTIARLGGQQVSEEVRNFAEKDPSLQSYANDAQKLNLLPRLPCRKIESDDEHVKARRSVYAVQAQYHRSMAYRLRDSQNAVQYCVLDDLWDSAQSVEDLLLSNAEETSRTTEFQNKVSNSQLEQLNSSLNQITPKKYAVKVNGSDDDAVSQVVVAPVQSWYAVNSKYKFAQIWQVFTQTFLRGQSTEKHSLCNALFSSGWAMPSGMEVNAAVKESTDPQERVHLLFNMLFRVVAQLAVWLDNNSLIGESINVNDLENGQLHLDLGAEPDSEMPTSQLTAENLYAAFDDLRCFWDMNKGWPEQTYAQTNRMAHEHMLRKNAKDSAYSSADLAAATLARSKITNTMHLLSLPAPDQCQNIVIDDIVKRHFEPTTDFINFAHDFARKFLKEADAVKSPGTNYFLPDEQEVPLLPDDLKNKMLEEDSPLSQLLSFATVHAAWAFRKRLLDGGKQIIQSTQNAKYESEPYRYRLSTGDKKGKVLYTTKTFMDNQFTVAIIQYHCALRQYCYVIKTMKESKIDLHSLESVAANLNKKAKDGMTGLIKKQKATVSECTDAAQSLYEFLDTLQSKIQTLAERITSDINNSKVKHTDNYRLPYYGFNVKFDSEHGNSTKYLSGQVESTIKSD